MEKKKINNAVKLTGWLGHNNKLFSLTCPQCGGMYESGPNCPKCQAPLVNITTAKGTPMIISEGTIYPMMGKATRERYEKNIGNTKNGMFARYRFKIFEFADETNHIPIPAIHSSLKKGALVEVMILDHLVEHKFFTAADGTPWAECMFKIYPHYGDTVKILPAAEAADATVSHEVNPDGTPAPMDNPYPITDANTQPGDSQLDAKLATMEKLLAEYKQLRAQQNTTAASATTHNEEMCGDVDPFEGI